VESVSAIHPIAWRVLPGRAFAKSLARVRLQWHKRPGKSSGYVAAHRMKTLVLIGNAAVKTDFSAFIDGSDCVVRLNDCRNHRRNTGSRTDVLFLNNMGDPSKVGMFGFFLRARTKWQIRRELPYLKTTKRVFFVRPSAGSCAAFLERHIPETNPLRAIQLEEIATDRNLASEITASLRLGGRSIGLISDEFYENVWRKLRQHGQTSAIMPSTGVLALEMILHGGFFDGYRTYVIGFAHEGWKGHPWELERKLFADYIGRNVVIPLDGSGSKAPADGPLVPHPARRTIQEMVFVSNLNQAAFARMHEKHPDSRVVYWDSGELDETAMRHASLQARHLVAEDSVAAAVSSAVRRPVTPLSRFDAAAYRRLVRAVAAEERGREPPFETNGRPVLFCPFNDTHVRTFAPISGFLREARFLLAGAPRSERAGEALDGLGIEYTQGLAIEIAKIRPSVLVLAKDWSPPAEQLMEVARDRGIPVVCLQEGPTEFGRDRRMQRCDYPFVQGAVMLGYLDQKIYFVTGNARFDRLKPVPLPAAPVIMLNSNFWNDGTERTRWLKEAVSVCQMLGLEFFVSRHPRDFGDLPDWPTRRSGSEVVHQQLAECSVVITPHSSIIYEAMLMGRNVICHDPRRAKINAFDEDRSGAFETSRTTGELLDALKRAIEPVSPEQQARIDSFLDMHCGERHGCAARRCASAIASVSWKAHHKKRVASSLLRHPALRPLGSLWHRAANRLYAAK